MPDIRMTPMKTFRGLYTEVLVLTVLLPTVLVTQVTGQVTLTMPMTSTAATIDEKCIRNKSLPVTEKDNVVDCQTPENIAANKTQCCTVGNDKGCCEPGGALSGLTDIGIAIGCTTAGLLFLVFIIFWCNKETFPCLEKCEKKCGCNCAEKVKSVCSRRKERNKKKPEKKDETSFTPRANSKSTSYPSDDERPSTSGSSRSDKKVSFGGPPPAPVPVYDMPEELKIEVVEDAFWGTV